MPLKYEIKEVAQHASLAIRTRTSLQSLAETIGKSYGIIGKYISEVKAQCTGAPFVIYYNMDMNDLDVEMGFPVDKKYAGNENIKSSEVPGGKVLALTHIGPYNELERTYKEAMAYISENKIETTGIVCESYPNDPEVTPPAELQTDIMFYLKS
jgi:effector-binding domain-containing protein